MEGSIHYFSSYFGRTGLCAVCARAPYSHDKLITYPSSTSTFSSSQAEVGRQARRAGARTAFVSPITPPPLTSTRKIMSHACVCAFSQYILSTI